MGVKNYIFLIFLFFPVILFSQVDTAWIRRYNGPRNGSDYASAVAVDRNGNVYVTGWSYGTEDDYLTIKYNSDGNRSWTRRYNGPSNGSDYSHDIAIDNLGNVYVTGSSYGTSYDYLTIKYDTDGNRLWVKRYNGPGNNIDVAYGIAVDNLGNVYVTGGSYDTSYDYLTIKYDTDGNRLWVKRYNGPGNNIDVAYGIVVDNLGNVYVTGGSYDTSYDYLTIKYDTDGNRLWVKRYNGPGNNIDVAYSIAVDNFGNIYVTGESYGIGTSYDYATVKYDSEGNELWVRRYNGPGNLGDYAYALAVDNLGNVYVTGTSYGINTSYDYVTIKYDSNGNEIWVKRYNGPGDSIDIAYSIAVDNLGNVYVTGFSYDSSTSYDYATVKYDSEGNELWVRRYNGPGNLGDYAYALAVDNLGNVYVTGTSYGINTSYDYATIKYDPDGNEVWVKRYNGPGNFDDYAYALAVDDLGNVYVTGGSFGLGTFWDYATIKYIQEQANIDEKNSEEREISFKGFENKKIYDITGKLITKNKKLKKGIYFSITEEGKRKIIILK